MKLDELNFEIADKIVDETGQRLQAYMERTQLGFVNAWRVWRETSNRFELETSFDDFFHRLRARKTGTLVYCERGFVACPEMGALAKTMDPRSACAWEVFDYFYLIGETDRVRRSAVFDFLEQRIGLDPETAAKDVLENFVQLRLLDGAEDGVRVFKMYTPAPAYGEATADMPMFLGAGIQRFSDDENEDSEVTVQNTTEEDRRPQDWSSLKTNVLNWMKKKQQRTPVAWNAALDLSGWNAKRPTKRDTPSVIKEMWEMGIRQTVGRNGAIMIYLAVDKP